MLNFALIWSIGSFLLGGGRRSHVRRPLRPILLASIALACAMQTAASNADRPAYQSMIELIVVSDWFSVTFIEPGFYLLVKGLSLVFTGPALETAVFFFVAFLSLALKLRLFSRAGGPLENYLLVFFAYFFLLQEATQIRIGLALSCVYLYIFAVLDRRRGAALAWLLAAVSCHYSAALVPVFVALVSSEMNAAGSRKFAIAGVALVILSIGAALYEDATLNWILGLGALIQQSKTEEYLQLLEGGVYEDINFVARLAPHLLVIGLMWVWRARWRGDRLIWVFLQLYCYGVLAFLLLSPLPVMAYRISDILLFSGILVMGRFAVHVRSRGLYTAGLVVYSGVFLVRSLFYSQIFVAAPA